MSSQQHTVIVGGSSGIGLETARHLLASGARSPSPAVMNGASSRRRRNSARSRKRCRWTRPMQTSFPAHSRESVNSIMWFWRSEAVRARVPSAPCVNGVSPGVIDTPWWDAVPEEQRRALFADYAAKTPVGRVGRSEDVAKAIVFLIEDDFMTGHTLICDGGLRFTA